MSANSVIRRSIVPQRVWVSQQKNNLLSIVVSYFNSYKLGVPTNSLFVTSTVIAEFCMNSNNISKYNSANAATDILFAYLWAALHDMWRHILIKSLRLFVACLNSRFYMDWFDILLIFCWFDILLLLLLLKPAALAKMGKTKLFINCFCNHAGTCAMENRRKHYSGKQPMVDCTPQPVQRSGAKHSTFEDHSRFEPEPAGNSL